MRFFIQIGLWTLTALGPGYPIRKVKFYLMAIYLHFLPVLYPLCDIIYHFIITESPYLEVR